jgi:hypothetical protein
MDDDPAPPPLRINGHLQEIARRRHRQEERHQSETGGASAAAVAELGYRVDAPDHTDRKDQQGR